MHRKVAIIEYILKSSSVLSCFNHIQLFEILWTVSLQAICPWIFQAKILEGVAISSSKGFSQCRDWTCLLCLLPWQTYSLPLAPPGKPLITMFVHAKKNNLFWLAYVCETHFIYICMHICIYYIYIYIHRYLLMIIHSQFIIWSNDYFQIILLS